MKNKKFKFKAGRCDEVIDFNKSVGWNIRNLRKYHGYTQKEFADSTYIDVKRIRRYEKDEDIAITSEMKIICEKLEVSYMALFFRNTIDEIIVDDRTGLSSNTIKWLEMQRRSNNGFIDFLNKLSENPQIFDGLWNMIDKS